MPALIGTSTSKTMEQTATVECHGCNGGKHCTCPCANFCPNCNMPKCRAQREMLWAPGTLNTEYRHQYPEKNVPKDVRAKQPFVESVGQFDPTTTHKHDFTDKNGGRAKSMKPNNGLGPQRPFDGRSTYNTYHDGKKGPAAEALGKKHDNYSGPFYGATTNRADFTDKGNAKRDPNSPDYSLINVPFEGKSTYTADFDKKKIPEKDPRNRAALLPSMHTDNYTTYGLDYVPLPLSKTRTGKCCADTKHTAVHVNLTTHRQTGETHRSV